MKTIKVNEACDSITIEDTVIRKLDDLCNYILLRASKIHKPDIGLAGDIILRIRETIKELQNEEPS